MANWSSVLQAFNLLDDVYRINRIESEKDKFVLEPVVPLTLRVGSLPIRCIYSVCLYFIFRFVMVYIRSCFLFELAE